MSRADASNCPTCGVRSFAEDGKPKRQAFDGYHTFDELYEHRIRLWIAVCKSHDRAERAEDGGPWSTSFSDAWRSRKHSDGSAFDGWFLLGLFDSPGEQITYHLPDRFWGACDFAVTRDTAPEFDGHTSADVLERLAKL